ncbi:cytochrome ubiquinol oxidase subunit I [Actinocatenispora comari]|uniref:Cytochrome ubiquinol oxidase subunit I n=1 Tax=Actinocatenispora comari TaxID=2807577 RepID=A0A8J4EPA0_9ACTN|nr:cytochrome ubiquinol oxidase subunit I [Actinocatenispora comari]
MGGLVTAVDLARVQFALTANVHFLFVVLTLGLTPMIAIMQTRYVLTGRAVHLTMTRYWGQLYVVNYGLGIVTGLVMEFQFGLAWTGVNRVAGQVFGAPLALETIIAFFAEATFLGIWIFGWGTLPKVVHLVSFYLVTITAYASAVFVMVANGFLQHPVGYVLRDGTARVTDLRALFGNPEAVGALRHLVPAALMLGGMVVAGISAWQLRRRPDDTDVFLRSLRIGVLVGLAGAFFTFLYGWAQLDYLRTDQPGKVDAIMASKGTGTVTDRPPGWISVPFSIMQQFGEYSTYLGLFLLPFLVRRWIVRRRLLLSVMTWWIPLPFVAVVCGWLVREVGRQPWAVYGVLRTADATSLPTGQVAVSLAVFGVVVVGLAVTNWLVLLMLARRGPHRLALGRVLGDDEPVAAAEPAVV